MTQIFYSFLNKSGVSIFFITLSSKVVPKIMKKQHYHFCFPFNPFDYSKREKKWNVKSRAFLKTSGNLEFQCTDMESFSCFYDFQTVIF